MCYNCANSMFVCSALFPLTLQSVQPGIPNNYDETCIKQQINNKYQKKTQTNKQTNKNLRDTFMLHLKSSKGGGYFIIVCAMCLSPSVQWPIFFVSEERNVPSSQCEERTGRESRMCNCKREKTPYFAQYGQLFSDTSS